MSVMTYIGAIGAAQHEAMVADDRVVIIGEDVEANVYGTTGESKQRAESGDFVQQFGKTAYATPQFPKKQSSVQPLVLR